MATTLARSLTLVQKAVEADTKGDYSQACVFYWRSLVLLQQAHGEEQDPAMQGQIAVQATNYEKRRQELLGVIPQQQQVEVEEKFKIGAQMDMVKELRHRLPPERLQPPSAEELAKLQALEQRLNGALGMGPPGR